MSTPEGSKALTTEEKAIVRGLKHTAVAMVASGLQSRKDLIDQWLANSVSDDRTELETIVDGAFEGLTHLDRFRELMAPVEGSPYEVQREAALKGAGMFHQAVLDVLEASGDDSLGKSEAAFAMVQKRLGVSREVAERTVKESALLGMTALLSELGVQTPENRAAPLPPGSPTGTLRVRSARELRCGMMYRTSNRLTIRCS
jgi:hypothetical protein